MEKKKNFYGLFGANGFGVFKNWEDVVKQRVFVEKCNAKGFTTAEAAFECAKKQYNAFQREPINMYQDRYLGVKMNILHTKTEIMNLNINAECNFEKRGRTMKVYIHAPAISISGIPSEYVWKKAYVGYLMEQKEIKERSYVKVYIVEREFSKDGLSSEEILGKLIFHQFEKCKKWGACYLGSFSVGGCSMKRTYKAGLYLRLSKEDGDKEESNSIESQRNILMRFLNDSDDMEYIDEYVDDGYTGTNFNRPGFQKMFADLERGILDCIIVKDLSRFGRNYLDVGRYVQQIFPRMNIRFVAINDNVDTKDEYENGFDMMLPIKNVFNESYSRDISRKVQSSFKAMQYAGLFTGAYCSYGYVKNPADKHKLVIDPYAAAVVKKIFNWYISGMGQRGIAAKLNEEKIVCPAEYKRQNGEKYRNSKRLSSTTYWTYSTVHRVLKNGMYKGCMVQNKSVRRMREKAKARSEAEWIVVEGTHEAIIDPETFDRVQELLKQRTKSMDFETNPSIFVGFLKCGDCGRAMVKRSYMQKNGKRRCFYTCGAYARSGSPICSNHNINHEVLEKVILDDLNKVISKISDLKDLVEKNEQMSKQQNLHLGKRELERVVAQLEKVLRLKREAYADYKENLISKEEYIVLREEYLQQEDSLNRRKEVLQQQEKEDQNTLLESKWVTGLLEHKGLTKLDRDTVVQFLDEVLVYETDKKGNQRIKIKYRFSDDMDLLFQTVYTEKD